MLPTTEIYDNSKDKNYNGTTNENDTGCGCTPDATSPYYTNAADTKDVGLYKNNTKTCNANGKYNTCVGAPTQAPYLPLTPQVLMPPLHRPTSLVPAAPI